MPETNRTNRRLSAVLGVAVSAFLTAAAHAEICHEQHGFRLECTGTAGQSHSADFSGNCSQVPNYVEVPCPTVYEERTFNRFQALAVCNLDADDPHGYSRWPLEASCHYDTGSARQMCIQAGYEGYTTFSMSSYHSPHDNGLTIWEEANGRFRVYNARDMGNRRIDRITCYRYAPA